MKYVATTNKELKRLLKEGKSPIIVKDQAAKTVKILEAIKNRKKKNNENAAGAISELGIIAIVIASAITILSLYGLYKNKKVKVIWHADGSGELTICKDN